MTPKVAIILIKYNQPELEAATIRHVLDTVTYQNYTLVAHQNERGVGLATIWNRLIAAQDAEIILLLNTDTVPTRGAIDLMLEYLLDSGVAAVVPSSNKVHLSQVRTDHWWAPDTEPHLDTIAKFAAALRADDGETQLPTASAMCVAFRKDTWENAGRFDEEFFLYGEDTEFFYRVAKTQGVILWVHAAYVHHYGQQSMKAAIAAGELDYQKQRAESQSLWERKKAEIDDTVSS
jgi:GT2 family glycosyltransferase